MAKIAMAMLLGPEAVEKAERDPRSLARELAERDKRAAEERAVLRLRLRLMEALDTVPVDRI